jgi:2-polyprenyl-3-methyl-5-hydroxy-6-metoxy-1,4-benzoquinol methylase
LTTADQRSAAARPPGSNADPAPLLAPRRHSTQAGRARANPGRPAVRPGPVLTHPRPLRRPLTAGPPRPGPHAGVRYTDLGKVRLPTAARDIHALGAQSQPPPVPAPGLRNHSDVREEIASRAPALLSDTDRLLDLVGEGPAFAGLCRYLTETTTDGYASAGLNRDVLRVLLGPPFLAGARVADLACGNGEVLWMLRQLGAHPVGVDVNPLFIQQAHRAGLQGVLTRADLPFGKWEAERGLAPGSFDVVLCTLALDRVEQPRELVANIFRLLGPGGRFAIQTLLPIVGVDDGPVTDPIVYTPPEHRLTAGENADTDRAALLSMLASNGGRRLSTRTIPYGVRSRDGLQRYTLHSFTGHRCWHPTSGRSAAPSSGAL